MSWRRIRLLMWKELLQLRRDHSMLPLLIMMPILQLILFGYVVGADIKDLRLAVLNEDHGAESRRIESAFTASGYFRLVDRAEDETELRKLLDGNKAAVGVIIPAGTGEAIQERRASQIGVFVDGSDGRVSQIAGGHAAGIVGHLNAEFYGSPSGGAPPGLSPGVSPGLDVRTRVLFNPTLRAVNTMIPGLLALIILMSISLVMSQAVVKERENGTLEQLFVTPIGRADYLIGKLSPYALIGIVQVLVVFLVGTTWFDVPFRGSGLVVGAGLLLFMFCALGIGLLVSVVSKTRQQAQQLVIFLQLPQILLSGFIFPLAALPGWLHTVSYLIPLRYILVIMRSNFMKASSMVALWPEFTALAIFSVAIFAVGLMRFRKQLAD